MLLMNHIANGILDKFSQGIGSELGKIVVENLLKRLKQLVGQVIQGKYLQSKPETVELFEANDLISEQGIDYSELQKLLKEGNWKEADYKTYLLMLQAVGRPKGDWIREKEMLQFPCPDLHIIDKLWTRYSQGKFGFSAQKEIWDEIHNLNGFLEIFKWTRGKFSQRVGWLKIQGSFKEQDELNFSLNAPRGHLPCTLRISGALRSKAGSGFWLFSCLASRLKACTLP